MISPRVAALSSSSGKRRLIRGEGGGGGSPPGAVVRFDPRIPGGGGCNTNSLSPGCSGYGSYEFVCVVRRGASVGALTDFGGVGRGGQVWFPQEWIRIHDCWPMWRVRSV